MNFYDSNLFISDYDKYSLSENNWKLFFIIDEYKIA